MLCLAILAAAVSAQAGDSEGWTRFRGPNGSGVAAQARPPMKIGPVNLAWKTPVPRGLSAPVLSGGKVFLTGLENDRLLMSAYDAASGRQLWSREAPRTPLEPVHEVNTPATPSPCADDERVYAYFGSYGLICYDLGGGELWKKPLPTPRNLYGMAASPILHGGRVILVLDDDANLPESKLSKSRMIALNKLTGDTIWETARPLQRSGWSTPSVWGQGASEELIVFGSGRLAGYDPQTGAEKWFATGFARETIVVPAIGSEFVYASSAMGGIADEKPDLEPLWQAMLHFDSDRDGRIARAEMTEHFTFPLRPEVPPSHPGFGIPLPSDPAKRAERQQGIFNGIDKDRDGFWTRAEFTANLGPRPFKPMLAAIRPGGSGNVTDTHIAWRLNRSVPEIPSPIIHQDRLYLVRNGGILTAVNASTGKIIYDERLGAGGQYTASPVIAHDRLCLVSNQGMVSIVQTGDRFELLHQHDLGEPALVTPAIDPSTLYFRTESHLQAFRER